MAKVTASKILEIARKEIGTKATNVKKCKYNTWYYGSAVSGSCYDWCAVFICWLFAQAGASDMIPIRSAGCGVLASGFNNKGKFYKSNFKAGDIVFFHWSNDMSSSVSGAYTLDHVGIIEKVNSDGTVTTIEGNTGSSPNGEVMRRVRSLSCISGVARPDYIVKSNSSNKNDVSTTKKFPIITYKVRVGGRWLPAVTNWDDYAGIKGKPITDIAIKASKGSVRYRVHLKGGNWLGYVTGYNTNDHIKGYAGCGLAIDAVDVYYTTPSDVRKSHGKPLKAKYRVSPVGGNYYSNQYDNETRNGQDGYAGSFGKAIDRVQITLAY